MPNTAAAPVYVLTGHNSYLLHIDGADGALCGSAARVTPTDAKLVNPRSAVHAKCLELHQAAQAAAPAPATDVQGNLEHTLAYVADPATDADQAASEARSAAYWATLAQAAAPATGDTVTFNVELADTDRIGARRHRLVTAVVGALGGEALVFVNRSQGRASTAGYTVRVTVAPAVARTARVLIAAALHHGEQAMNAAGAAYRAAHGLSAQQRDSGYQDVRRATLTAYAADVAALAAQGRQGALDGLLASA